MLDTRRVTSKPGASVSDIWTGLVLALARHNLSFENSGMEGMVGTYARRRASAVMPEGWEVPPVTA